MNGNKLFIRYKYYPTISNQKVAFMTWIQQETIKIRKKYSIKLSDSIIIATATYLDLPLITSDTDFKKVDELTLIHYENWIF